ncbi:hypothetical protein Rhal01_03125 [Rubritalea halochordaticola]|uniref:Ice-binding protein C-terminal domain-containing protein n=1 Tax=Rubritalea halochordaticola TaxID=714537 RepID=A0ABP9V6E8_9BACT
MKKCPLVLCSLLAAGGAQAAIVVPTYVAGSSTPNTFSTSSPQQMVNGAGLLSPVENGDSLATALSANHVYDGGFDTSWVTNASGSDYFIAGTIPVLVFDLGADIAIADLVFWQYENNGGGTPGNHAKTLEIRFSTEANGLSFGGASDLDINMQSVPDLGGTNSAQDFSAGGVTARYIQVTVTDNYAGDFAGGGDRVGLGEFRVNEVPEPSGSALLGLGVFGLLLRRKRD